MSLKLTQRLTIFLDRRSHNWQQRMCLITFLVLSLSVIVAGVPMHIFGFIGRNHVALQALSALTWVTTLVFFCLLFAATLVAESCYIHVRHIDTTNRQCTHYVHDIRAS